MSVIIKDMEMPKSCRDCPFPTEEMWGAYKCQYAHKWGDDENRADDCPLIEISTPHGRLIDADKIEYHFNVNENTAMEGCEFVTKGEIDRVPTIVEKEE